MGSLSLRISRIFPPCLPRPRRSQYHSVPLLTGRQRVDMACSARPVGMEPEVFEVVTVHHLNISDLNLLAFLASSCWTPALSLPRALQAQSPGPRDWEWIGSRVPVSGLDNVVSQWPMLGGNGILKLKILALL